jgi:glycosyltransferase involved in cell wall biosynthesis
MASPPRQVPAYDRLVLRPRATAYALCVPVLNEGERIRSQLEKMRELEGEIDVIIADGGSSDGALAEERLRAAGVRALLTKTGPGRLGAQIRMAFDYCLDEGYQGVALIDGNDKDEPVEVRRFMAKLDQGWDFIQGSRFVPGGRAIRNPAARLWGIRLLHAPLLSLASGVRYTDTTNGFRAYSRRLLEDPRVAVFRDQLAGYELHYYLARRAARLGLRVCEVPVTRSYPADGAVPTKIHGFRGNLKVLGALADVCRGRYDPPSAAAREER